MWNRLSQLGVTGNSSGQSAKRITLVNRLSMIFGGTVLLYGVIFLFLGLQQEAFVLFGTFVALVCVLFLNNYRQYLTAAQLTMIAINTVVFYSALSCGKAGASSLVFFYTAILPWFIFDVKHKVHIIGSCLLSVGLYFYIALVPFTPFVTVSAAVATFLFISSSIVAFGMLTVTIVLFYNDSNRNEQFLSSTNNILQETKKKLQYTLTENDAVVKFAQVMYSNGNSIDELCKAGMNKLKELLPYTYGAIMLYDKTTDTLKVQEEIGFDSGTRRSTAIKNGESLTGDVFLRQKMVRINDAPDSYWKATSAFGGIKPAELIIMPMTFKAQAGVLEVAFIKPLGDPEMALLQRISVALAANLLVLEGKDENTALVAMLQEQKEKIEHSYAELEETREKMSERVKEQYEAQQVLIKQIIDKGKQKEDELQARINELQLQIQAQ